MALSLIVLGFTLFFGYIYLMIRLDKKLYGENDPAPDKPVDLTLLAKEDYDFLRTNGLEVDQKIHDHFYPPVYDSLGGWGETIDRQPIDKFDVKRLTHTIIKTKRAEHVRIITPEIIVER